jgi:phosphoglycerate kinase
MKNINEINKNDLKNKKILLRLDYNVPILENQVLDKTNDSRIKSTIPLIKFLQENNCKIIIFSHLGRIKKEEDKKKLSLKIVAEHLSSLLKENVIFVNETRGKKLEEKCKNLKQKQVLIVENTRFEDLNGKKESSNDNELAKYWSSLGDIFINDAFATSHRLHASTYGIAQEKKDKSYYGFLIAKEIEMLNKVLINPEKPFIGIIGGAKVSDKIKVIRNIINKVDYLLIGGAMGYIFLKAKKYNVGHLPGTKEEIEKDIELASDLIKNYNSKIILPIDCEVNDKFADEKSTTTKITEIQDNHFCMDIGPETVKLFNKYINKAKTILWNGPLGVCEFKNYENGTLQIAKEITNLKNTFSVVGGGDSVVTIYKNSLENGFSHISTGGGATLQYLSDNTLEIFKFAVIKIKESNKKQILVTPKTTFFVDKINEEEGKIISNKFVLMMNESIGQPYLKNAEVKYKIIKHGKSKKEKGFRYKAKKNSKKKYGYRKSYTKIEIISIENSE